MLDFSVLYLDTIYFAGSNDSVSLEVSEWSRVFLTYKNWNINNSGKKRLLEFIEFIARRIWKQ